MRLFLFFSYLSFSQLFTFEPASKRMPSPPFYTIFLEYGNDYATSKICLRRHIELPTYKTTLSRVSGYLLSC